MVKLHPNHLRIHCMLKFSTSVSGHKRSAARTRIRNKPYNTWVKRALTEDWVRAGVRSVAERP
jgi:hypothetical protein